MEMNFFKKIESIKAILKTEGYLDIANDILEGQLSGGTGGEVLIICWVFFKKECKG